MVQLLIDRGADVNVKSLVCHLIPVFCYNTVNDMHPSSIGFMLLFSCLPPGLSVCVCVCVHVRACVRMCVCVPVYVLHS